MTSNITTVFRIRIYICKHGSSI